MDVRQLEYFVSVARNASFSRAAEEKFTSQTAVSYHTFMVQGMNYGSCVTFGYRLGRDLAEL